ncbi:MAG: TolC family protein [Acidobacteria bacterium]|nr:TolC family protein [Acidobacteriota bacterium]
MQKRLITLLLVLALSLGAQFSTFPDKTYFREQWARAPLDVQIEAVSHLQDFLYDGELELSLRAFLELAMSNNPDINLSKLAIFEEQNNIQRAFSPFDPSVTAGFNSNRSTTPSNDQLQGAAVVTQLNQSGRFTYSQQLDTGAEYTVGYVGSKSASNSQFNNFNPSIRQSLSFTVSQPLLRDRGRFVQRIPIMIARSRLAQTEEQVRERILLLIFQAETDYWNTVNTREQLRVQENNLEISRAFLAQENRRLELGAISPLDIFQPQQNFANAQVRVTQEQYRLQQAEDALRRWIGADLDPDFRNVAVVLTEPVEPPAYMEGLDVEVQVARALLNRPELERIRRSLQIDDLNIRGATNDIRPDLSVSANYSAQGRGGNFFDRSGLGGSIANIVPGGFPEAFDQLFQFRFPTYGFGLTLQLPLRNRAAAANLADAAIQKKRNLYTLRGSEQNVRLDVVQAVAGVDLAKAAVEQATVALGFAQQRLDAEQKKYDLGVNTAFFVLQAQNDLVDAEAQVLAQAIAYRRSLLTLLRSTGELLEARGVALGTP